MGTTDMPYSLDELHQALIKADKAGNTADAQALADEIHRQTQQAPVDPHKAYSSGPKTRINPDVQSARDRIAEEDKVFGKDAGGGGPLAGSSKLLDNFFTNVLQNVPYAGEYLDEATAAAKTGAGYIGDYGKELAYNRERRKQFKEEDPLLYKVAGATGVIGGSAIGGSAALGGKSLAALEKMSRAQKILLGMGIGGVGGGSEGFVSGFGAGQGDFDSRLEQAKGEGKFGALAGTAGGLVMPFLGPAIAKLGLSKAKLKALYKELGLSPESSGQLQRVLQKDDALSTVGQGSKNVTRAGEGAIVGDTGQGARDQMDILFSQGGKPAQTVSKAIDTRLNDTANRFAKTRENVFPQPVGEETAKRAAKELTKEERAIKYAEAYRINPDYNTTAGREIQNQLRRVDPEHWGEVAKVLRDRGIEPTPEVMRMVKESPNTEELDLVTRSLSDAAQATVGTGKMGGMTPAGRRAQDQAATLRTMLGDINDPYKKALAESQGTIQQVNAVDFGVDLLKPHITTEAARLKQAEQLGGNTEDVLQGVSTHIANVMERAKGAIAENVDADEIKAARDAVYQLLSEGSKNKLALFMPPDKLDALFKGVNEMRSALALKLKQGSQTAIRVAGDQAKAQVMGRDTDQFVKKVGGGWFTTGLRALMFPLGKGKKAKEAAGEQFSKELADFLTRTVGPDQKPLRDLAKLRATERALERAKRNASGRGSVVAPFAFPGLVDQFSTEPVREGE